MFKIIAIKREHTGDKINKLKKDMLKEAEKYFLSEKINNDLLNSVTLVINELKSNELQQSFREELDKKTNILLISNILKNLSLNNFK